MDLKKVSGKKSESFFQISNGFFSKFVFRPGRRYIEKTNHNRAKTIIILSEYINIDIA